MIYRHQCLSDNKKKKYLHPKINVPKLLRTINDIDKHKCIVNDMV